MEGLSGWVSLGHGSAWLGHSGWVSPIGSVRIGLSGWVRPTRSVWLGLTIHVRPPTSDGHNFFVRTLFWVFLDSMESPLSQDYKNVPMEDIGGP